MKTVRVKVDMASLVGLPQGRVDEARIAATTEAEMRRTSRWMKPLRCKNRQSLRAMYANAWG